MKNKSDYFEYIIQSLLKKYNREDNDFSILKSLLLTTYVIHTDSNYDKSCRLINEVFNNFYCSPFASYDYDVYKKIKNDGLKTMTITHTEAKIKGKLDISELDIDIIKLIDDSISKLLEYSPSILTYGNGRLVEIMHMHGYWKKNWDIARNKEPLELGKVPIAEVIESYKYWDLNPFELI